MDITVDVVDLRQGGRSALSLALENAEVVDILLEYGVQVDLKSTVSYIKESFHDWLVLWNHPDYVVCVCGTMPEWQYNSDVGSQRGSCSCCERLTRARCTDGFTE